MAFAIERDGEETEVQIDVTFDLSKFTLRELVRLEDVFGSPAMGALVRRELDITPRLMQAVIWTKLESVGAGVPMEHIDLPEGVFE